MSVLWSVYYVEKVLNVKNQASIKLSSLDEFIGQNNEQTHPPSQKKNRRYRSQSKYQTEG